MTDKVFETEHYVVRINDYGDGYNIYNKHTGVKEGVGEALPSTVNTVRIWSEVYNKLVQEGIL